MGIAVVGTIFADIKGYPVSSFIRNGRNPGRVLTVHGGVGRNIAEDLGRLGFKPVLAALSDKSALADEIKTRLDESGVDTRFIKETDSGMGLWLAIFDDRGDVASSISSRPDLGSLSAVLDEHNEEIFAACDGVVLEIDIEEAAVARVFEYAEKYGKEVTAVVSSMGIALERRRFFPKCACFICNLQEAGMLFEEDLADYDAAALPERVLNGAANAELSRLIVTLDENGAVYTDTKSKEAGLVPAEKTPLTDSVGAGDAFAAGAVWALTVGKSLAEACEAGNALAAVVIKSTENVCPVTDPGLIFKDYGGIK